MKKVIICGLGAVGLTYAVKLKDKCDLRILVDEDRFLKFQKQKPVFNGAVQEFEYLLPQDSFKPDIIIISTKSDGLKSAIQNIKNFVHKDLIILSLLNGISSENEIKSAYSSAKVLKSYFVGHSAVRKGNSVTQDGVGEIVVEFEPQIVEFFKKCNINYSCPIDINYSMWLKYTLNLFSNQASAILNMNFGELKENKNFINFAKNIIKEICSIAQAEGIKNLENLEKDALDFLSRMCDEGKTSMHQDILAGRKTEVEIFAGEVIKLGKKYGIETPYNQIMYEMIKILEEKNEHSVYSR